MIGLLPIFPVLWMFANAAPAEPAQKEVVSVARVAQVRLAETLAEADAIESVTAKGRAITFVIVRDGETLNVVAKTSKSGEVLALEIAPADFELAVQLHGLTWLGTELAEVSAVTRLVVDDD